MKKQILLLALFVLAMMAGTLTSYGQLGPSSVGVTPLGCASTATDGLHPFAGVPYTYTLTDAGTTNVADYTWWVTKDQDFITGPVGVIAAGALPGTNFDKQLTSPDVLNPSSTYGATTAAATAKSNEVTLTWGADLLAGTKYQVTPTFVVGYAKGAASCADNIQVYEIDPKPNFTLAILPIDPNTTTPTTFTWGDISGDAKECVDVVQSAKYHPGAGATQFMLDMDYGTNTFYYEVGAANFVKDWTPTFNLISGLKTTQTAVLTLYPSLADATGNTNALGDNSASAWTSAAGQTWASGIHLNATNPADASTGVSVFVKVVITNNNEESLTDNPFILAVDAQDNTETGIWDMEDADCLAMDDKADQVDQATIVITARPQLDAGTTSGTAPTTTIPKPSTSNTF